MADAEYQRLQEALTKANTPEARVQAAAALRQYEAAQASRRSSLQTKRKGSNPTLVSLALRASYPTAIPVSDLPEQIEDNPAVYDHLKQVLTSDIKKQTGGQTTNVNTTSSRLSY